MRLQENSSFASWSFGLCVGASNVLFRALAVHFSLFSYYKITTVASFLGLLVTSVYTPYYCVYISYISYSFYSNMHNIRDLWKWAIFDAIAYTAHHICPSWVAFLMIRLIQTVFSYSRVFLIDPCQFQLFQPDSPGRAFCCFFLLRIFSQVKLIFWYRLVFSHQFQIFVLKRINDSWNESIERNFLA